MAVRSLLNRVKTSEFQKGIFDNVLITSVDTQDRKGQNGPINKMIYIKFAQLNDAGKKVSESELGWWKPDVASEYFKTNLQEICLQVHNVASAYVGDDAAFDAFSTVFDFLDLEDQSEIETRKWKQSELNTVITNLKTSFETVITPFINNTEKLVRLKLSTNYKGEDIEIPKYGKFVEPMTVETTELKFTTNELKTHSKVGNVETKGAASSSNTNATI
jgi:hypothetical protein